MIELIAIGVTALAIGAVEFFHRHRKGYGISILVPFNCPDPSNQRAKNWRWLKKYWECQLPGAEIVMGEDVVAEIDPSIPFSKCVAVNDAARKAHGKMFVIVDADGYIPIKAVLTAVTKIRKAERRGRKLWFVPYRHFYRMTEDASDRLLRSDPCDPLEFSCPPPPCDAMKGPASGPGHGHWYGAMVQVMSRKAFFEVGGWDKRFRGWGGEDRAAMLAMDALYWPHKTLPGCVFHVWHPMLSPGGEDKGWVEWKRRVWTGQKESNTNSKLAQRYHSAQNDPKKMRKLLDEGLE
jgi:glycosyltransferase involved in cell wall biosynthesis